MESPDLFRAFFLSNERKTWRSLVVQ